MASYPKMFRIFISKQVSGWCGSNNKLSLWDSNVDNTCLNWGMVNKTSKHMTWCTHKGWVTLLHESVEEVTECLKQANADPDLLTMIKKYLLAQGSRSMESCITTGRQYILLAQTQDLLGWDCFIEDQIPSILIKTIKPQLHQYSPWKSIDKWGVKLVKSLLNITHNQWINRNADVYHVINGLTSNQHTILFAQVRSY
jgi:hypothetical protein